MIHWIVLDAMGVVYTVGDDTNDLLVPFVQSRNPLISREAINEIYLRASLGEIPARRLWEEVGLGDRYPDIESLYLDDVLVDPEFRPVAMRLARQFRLGLLSNDLAEWSRYLRARRGLGFDAVTISGDVHCRKPSPDIYRHFLRASGARPDECVFVDDRVKNLVAAAEQGFRTIRFEREEPGPDDYAAFQPDARIASFGELEEAVSRLGPDGIGGCGCGDGARQ